MSNCHKALVIRREINRLGLATFEALHARCETVSIAVGAVPVSRPPSAFPRCTDVIRLGVSIGFVCTALEAVDAVGIIMPVTLSAPPVPRPP